LFVAELDLREKKLSYINAGHFPPFMKCKGEVSRLEHGCTVIGAFENIDKIEMGICKLSGDGIILMFTDGLTDLKNSHGSYFEESFLEETVSSYNGHSAVEFNRQLLAEMEKFKGEMEYPDDIAVLTCRFKA
jgi:sigma-B regulation protein RsbU (phosphoserine phosphatase)